MSGSTFYIDVREVRSGTNPPTKIGHTRLAETQAVHSRGLVMNPCVVRHPIYMYLHIPHMKLIMFEGL